MDVKPIAQTGDRCELLLGLDWHSVKVLDVGRWSHASGNSHPVYRVELDTGQTLCCGNNSLKVDERGGIAE